MQAARQMGQEQLGAPSQPCTHVHCFGCAALFGLQKHDSRPPFPLTRLKLLIPRSNICAITSTNPEIQPQINFILSLNQMWIKNNVRLH